MAIPTTTTVYGKSIASEQERYVTLKDFKLTGLVYPPKLAPGKGYFSKSSGLELIKSSIKSLVRTERGERFMLPDYGCNLRKFLMEPLDQTTFSMIKEEVETSIRKYLGAVNLDKIQAFETRSNNINVRVFCSAKDTGASNFDVGIRI